MIDRVKLMEMRKAALNINEKEKKEIVNFCETVIEPLLIEEAKKPQINDIKIIIPVRFTNNYGYKFIPIKPYVPTYSKRKYWEIDYRYNYMNYSFFKEYLCTYGVDVNYDPSNYESTTGLKLFANLIITVTM